MVNSDISKQKYTRYKEQSAAISLFLTVCQVFFAISIIGKTIALIWQPTAFIAPDFILGIPQAKVMLFATFLEFIMMALLVMKNVGSPIKLGILLTVSSGFITYHVWAWMLGAPACPCMGNLIPKEASSKFSFLAAAILFVCSAVLMYKGEKIADGDTISVFKEVSSK